MKYVIENKYTKTRMSANSRGELDNICQTLGFNSSTLFKAKTGNRKTKIGWDLISSDEMLKIETPKTKVLVIGDIHAPFTHKKYLDFCKMVYEKEECNKVIFIGDIIDGHAFSRHKTHNNAIGVNTEFEEAIEQLKEWHEAFPNAIVTIGNHDYLCRRGNYPDLIIPDKVFKTWEEMLEVPTWKFVNEIIIDDVKYHHGVARDPKSEAQNDCISVVAGHRHSVGYVHYFVDSYGKPRFGMSVGAALDKNSYAAAYAKGYKPTHTNVGVVSEYEQKLVYMKEN